MKWKAAMTGLALAWSVTGATLVDAAALQPPQTGTEAATPAISLGELARELRAERRHLAPQPPVFTNRTIPPQGHVSTPGTPETAPTGTTAAAASAEGADTGATNETAWRKKFADARQQLTLDQQQLDVTQRELNLAQQQYYSNPNQALMQQYSRSDLTQKTQQVDALKAKVAADQKALSDLEDQLRQAGLPPGWAQ